MSLKELLMEVGQDYLRDHKLITLLFSIKNTEIDQGIALILSEVLIPGSQGLTSNPNSSFTFSNTIPEASAKGAQLQAALKEVDSDANFTPNWYEIFAVVHENLFDASKRNYQPSPTSFTLFFTAIDFKMGIIDIFLNYDWWFNRHLLLFLHTTSAQPGGFSILELHNLTLCFEDDASDCLLRFVNIGKLELLVMTQISQQEQFNLSEPDQKLNLHLHQTFADDCRRYLLYLIVSALSIVDRTVFIDEILDTLLTILLDLSFNEVPRVLLKIKELDLQLALQKLSDYYARNPTLPTSCKLTRLAVMTKLADDLVSKMWLVDFQKGLTFTVDAFNHGHPNMKELIESKFQNPDTKGTLCQAILEHLEMRASFDFEKAQQGGANFDSYISLRVPVVYYLLEKLKGSKGLIDAERLKNIQLLLLTTYPRLINFGCGHDEAILVNEANHPTSFPPQVEQEMKAFYSKMYNKEMEIKDIVDMLVKMKYSDVPHDQDIFACMIHSLLDEYRFFAEYPLTALASTSLLFGALLQKDLIQGTTLTVALNFIWESCNQPQDSHLFKFAVQSLYNFKSRLHEYPIYCKHLLECQSLSAHAKMYQIVKDASQGIPCPEATPNGRSQTPASEKAGIKYQSITVTDKTIGFVQQEQPDEAISDKLLFFINNMTGDNLHGKFAEVKDSLTEQYFLWFANYLVADRAKSEPNNHQLYFELVKVFDNAIFTEYVLSVSLKEVEHLISHVKDSAIDRGHLKNLGAWLGLITLANDKPLKRDQISLKYLLVEAFDLKSLHHVIPFVCKILDQAQYSKVFSPPNPWTLGLLQVLVELYECADLKLNLKFEVEVLLNSFHLKVSDIEASTIIRSHNPATLAGVFGDVSGDLARLSLQPPTQPQAPLQLQREEPAAVPVAPAAAAPALDTSFSNLVGDTVFTQNPNLRRAFQASLSRAVRECAVPILSRVSEAVLTTTEALIKKDFATEGDATKLRKSYQTLAQQLSHSMVVCSGRKILSETIEATMVQLLGSQMNPNELPLAELSVAVQANVDLCVDIVNKIAAGNIAELIDERMHKYVTARDRRGDQPFVDTAVSNYALKLPPPLGLQPNGLNPAQLAIYTGFGANGPKEETAPAPAAAPIAPTSAPVAPAPAATTPSTVPSVPSVLSGPSAPVSIPSVPEEIPADQLFTAITANCEKAIQLLLTVTATKLSDLPGDHPIMVALTQTLTLAQSNALKFPELLLKVAQYAVNCLFTQAHENPMSNEIYVVVLDKLCEYSPSTAKDVTWWLVHSSDQRKFNMPVIFSLLKVQLVQANKLDASVGRLISDSNSPVVVKFAANLLLNLFSSEELRPVAMRSDFAFSLEALANYAGDASTEEGRSAKQARDDLFDLLSSSSLPAYSSPPDLYSHMGYVFAEWCKLLSHGEDTDSLQDVFIEGLLEHGILTNPSQFEVFFKAATEVSIAAFTTEHETRTRTQRESYLAVDALALFIVKVILKFDNASEAIDYLRNILGILLLVLSNDHENFKTEWNERAYFRLFSSLLCLWNEASVADQHATVHLDSEFYPIIAEVFNSLQPIIYPGFTFAWISLIAHRMFLPRLLELPERRGYASAVKLFTAVLKFESVYGRDENIQHDVINVIFKAVNRLFVALAHDNPEFLVECHYQLVTAIPLNYIQLRNIVLSATPSSVALVNPFTQGLKVDRLPEINDAPVVAYKPVEDLAKVGLKKPVDNYLRIPAPGLMKTIYNGTKLNYPKESSDSRQGEVHYNVKIINALVLHVGISAVADKLPSNSRGFNTKSSHVALLVDLVNNGSLEFKFHIINAITNQLRYPNSHTQWFIGIILHFFSSNSIWGSGTTKLIIQEIITRVLLERHLVNKPHPWGLTIVFTELVKNGDYGFFDLPFVKEASKELSVIFEALSRNVKGGPLPLTTEATSV